MKILLVEPGYKNKYPPMGLMKLSTYHKRKGDQVSFVKGKSNQALRCFWDRVYISTLFTFDYDLTIETIRFYKKAVTHIDNIYIGGILASLMTARVKDDTGVNNVVVGQLSNSHLIGYDDNINIDCLPLDYDILKDIDYIYSIGDSYLAYTTRGCPNKCTFCAVPKLEPVFKTENHIGELIKYTNEEFGPKRNLLLLDNNVLNSPELPIIINDIKAAGFTKGAVYFEPVLFDIYWKKACRYPEDIKFIKQLFTYLFECKKYITHPGKRAEYITLLEQLSESEDKYKAIEDHRENILFYLEKYKDKRPKKRYVDFNQGIDARLLDEGKMQLLAQLPIRPLRIAFDSLNQKDNYERVVRLAVQYGIKDISNYILYNFVDKPDELWERLRINVDLREELSVDIFSFPMKYMPIDQTTRAFVGKHWKKKYLSAITAILLVTKGIVAHGSSFFYKAFGKSLDEYFEILAMPRNFIIYRSHFEKQGLTEEWRNLYLQLDTEEKEILLNFAEIIESDCNQSSELGKSSLLQQISKYYEMKQPKYNIN